MTAISASLYRLTSSGQLDSAAGEDGNFAVILLGREPYNISLKKAYEFYKGEG